MMEPATPPEVEEILREYAEMQAAQTETSPEEAWRPELIQEQDPNLSMADLEPLGDTLTIEREVSGSGRLSSRSKDEDEDNNKPRRKNERQIGYGIG